MSIKQNFSEVSPSLLLDFANSRTLDPRITFTRASVGTYVASNGLIKTAVANEARFDHDPNTGESLGLLIEESRTNLITNSNAPSGQNFNWNTVTTNDNVLTPDGKLSTVRRLTSSGSGQYTFRMGSTTAGSPNTSYTGSVWIRTVSGTVTVTADMNDQDGHGVSLSTDWVRFDSTATTPGSGGNAAYRFFDIYTNTTADLYVWGAQIEVGSFASSYIPTSGSTVTRAADTAKITGTNFTNFYNQSEGTLTINANNIKEGRYVSALTSGTTGSPDTLNLYRKDDDQWRIYNTSQVTFSSTDSDANAALAYSVSGTNRTAVAAWKGDLVNSPTDTTSIPFTLLQIGAGAKGTGISNGHISRLSYYSQRLTDSQLQNLTK